MTIIYYEQDADLNILHGKTIGVIGFGHLGAPIAHSIRDNGLNVLVSGSMDEQVNAQQEGFTVGTIRNVANQADILLLLLPDDEMPQVYIQEISPSLKRGDTLIFSSAFNIAFGFIEPPPFVDVGLVSPRTISGKINEVGIARASFVSVWQDASRHAWDSVLAVALATGALYAGAFELNIQQEAELSLFVQQALLPALYHTLLTASKLLIGQGYPPEAVLTDLYLSGKFTDYVQQASQKGLLDALATTGKAGQYGTLSRLDRFRESKLERLMEITLDEIRQGDFSGEWAREHADGNPRLSRLLKQMQLDEDLWEMEAQTLEMLFPEE